LPEIFTNANVEKLLRSAESKERRILPFLTIGFFAGLRTAELDGIRWEDVDLAAKLITVRPEVAKKRRQRHVTMSDNLVTWLLPHKKEHGKVCPLNTTWRIALKNIRKDTDVQWVKNGMRHTFASNHLAQFKDVNKTAFELGHTGRVDVLFNHYRSLVKPADAELYWSIRPASKDNITLLPKAV